MKKIIMTLLMVLVLTALAYAHGETGHDDLSGALEIIENKVSCDDLTDNEFELLGDYYMELMHPGDAHIAMDEMMGGEGSDSLRIMHINMGKRFYCGSEAVTDQGIMMDGMMGNANSLNTFRTGMMQSVIGSFNPFNGYNLLNTFVIMVLAVILILAGAWFFKTVLVKENPGEILKTRLAKGDITKKEFVELKKELG